jgi:mannose/cellobiose epimerase-like protein (N-acyl-D-glucosamine 2-epimerase family)
MKNAPWTSLAHHRDWLKAEANGLLAFFERRSINPKGGFFAFDDDGRPLDPDNPVRPIHATARMVHCFAIAQLMGRPGASALVDHGMDYLWNAHRDAVHGGYFWSMDNDGPRDASKQGYGHAFVLLAASSARTIGHPLADRMLDDITDVIETRFWEQEHGAIAEEFSRDWGPVAVYRGQNSNMHLTEALMAAFEATGHRHYLDKAVSIAELIINDKARATGFRVGEHFDQNWTLDKTYKGDEMFRPSGTTPGHWLEWARLILQLWALSGKQHDWMPGAAAELFRQSMELGWDKARGGFHYTLDWDDRPAGTAKLWWPMAEGAGAAAFLNHHRPNAFHEDSYRMIWNVIARHFIDLDKGGWHEELTDDLTPAHSLFAGKSDIYHALQACLIPLYPAEGSLTKMILEHGG